MGKALTEYNMEQVQSLNKFLKHWTLAMEDTHWFKEHVLFHYSRDEMIEEITEEFTELDNIHLVAKSKQTKEMQGVLRVRIQGNVGTFGRWEPAVPLKYRDTEVGEALVKKALSLLKRNDVSKVNCMLKYTFCKLENVLWHIALYEKSGFKQKGPVGIMLLAELPKIKTSPSEIKNLHCIDGKKLPLAKFADFVQKAYMSTPRDRAIHAYDPYISKRTENLKILQAIRRGKMGFSPPEFWKIAKHGSEDAGFVTGFMPQTKSRPTHGVIANIGVFPQFRRKGIASALLDEIHDSFNSYGCRYSYVGTPETNDPALKLYRKAGYEPVFELMSFETTLLLQD